MSPNPRLSFRIIFYFIIGVLFLGITETGARIFEYFGPRTFLFKKFDPVLGVSLIPSKAGVHRRCYDGYVSINSHGMRDAPRTLTKRAEVYRIGVFSDSTIEGLHVFPNQVSTRRLESKLNNRLNKKSWEVLNFSVGGFGTLQEYLRYVRDGKKFDLDLVILFLVGNDLQNNLPGGIYDGNLYGAPSIKIVGEKEYVINYPSKPILYEPLTFLMDISAAFRFAYKFYYHYIYGGKIKNIQNIQGFPVLFSLLDPQNEDGQHAWRIEEFVLSLFAKEIRKDGAKMFLVHSGYDIYEPSEQMRALADDYMKKTGHNANFTYATKRLTDWAQRENIPIFNFGLFLHNYYKKEGLGEGDLSYSCDSHFNPEGHNVIAEFLFKTISSSGLIENFKDVGN